LQLVEQLDRAGRRSTIIRHIPECPTLRRRPKTAVALWVAQAAGCLPWGGGGLSLPHGREILLFAEVDQHGVDILAREEVGLRSAMVEEC